MEYTLKKTSRLTLESSVEYWEDEENKKTILRIEEEVTTATGEWYSSGSQSHNVTSEMLKSFVKNIKEAMKEYRDYKQVDSKESFLAADIWPKDKRIRLFFHPNKSFANEVSCDLTTKETEKFIKTFE